jgi:hypothetical protein
LFNGVELIHANGQVALSELIWRLKPERGIIIPSGAETPVTAVGR